METVSIIIPAFNAEAFVRRAIESCVKQTYHDVEIIVVDDGSEDNTFAIASSVEDKRIKIIKQKNSGVCKARNVGIESSIGQFVFFLDADDELTENCIQSLYSLFNSDTDIVCGTSINYSEKDSLKIVSTESSNEKWDGETGLVKSLLDNPYTYAVWNKLYRKRFINDTKFCEGRKIHEDSFFLFELFTKKPNVIIDGHVTYLVHDVQNSASRQCFSDKFYDILYFRDKKIEIVKEQFPHLSNYIGNVVIKSDMALLEKLISSKGKKEEERELIKEIKHFKKSFIPATDENKKFFFIIVHNLYFIYKLLKNITKRK